MQRTALSVIAGILAAAIIGVSLTVLFWDDDVPLAIDSTRLSPSPTAPLRTPVGSPTTEPSPTAASAAAAPPTTVAAPSPTPPPAPPPSAQPALSVDCNRTPAFCTSTTDRMEVRDDKLVSSGTTQHNTDYSSVPNTTMVSRIIAEGGGDARNGDEVHTLHVEVEIRNDTNKTYVVPDREIALVVLLDGEVLHELVTDGEDFEMRPGGVLTARFDVPLAFDGNYEWRGKTSYREK